jgi:hypothetical protein
MKIQIDGADAFVYKVSTGQYSDYSEDWWWHRERLTSAELIARLLSVLPEIDAAEAATQAKRDAYTREHFGCTDEELDWEWERDARGLSTGKRLPKNGKGSAEELEAWFKDPLCQRSYQPREACLKAAAFMPFEPEAVWHTDDHWRYAPGAYEAQLERDLANV